MLEDQEREEQMRNDLEAAEEDEYEEDGGIVREADQFKLKKKFDEEADDTYAQNA
jgi:hypothetical protein